MPIVRRTGARVAASGLVDAGDLDPTYGAELGELLECRAPSPVNEPDDFDAFWAGVRHRALAVDPDPRVGCWRPWQHATGWPEHTASYEVADLTYIGVDGFRIGGWVVRPRDGADQIAVCGHGYGGRMEPACDDAAPSALCVYPVARGLPTRSEVEGIGREAGQRHHVIWGIEYPETYSVVKSTADYFVASTVAQLLLPGASRMIYHGGSFGGGVGAMLLSIDDRFDGALLGVPTFGNQPLRITQESLGSGEVVRQYFQQHPEALEVLCYADAASAARRVRIPVFATPALADPVVPPQGQFSVVNSLAGPVWMHVLAGGHGEWADFDLERRSGEPSDWDEGPGGRQAQRPLPAEIDEFLRSCEPY